MPSKIDLSELTFEKPVKYETIRLSLRKLSSNWTSVKPADKRFVNTIRIFGYSENSGNGCSVFIRKCKFRKIQDDIKTKKTKKLKIEEICRNLSKMPETSKFKTQLVDKDNNHIPNSAQRIISK